MSFIDPFELLGITPQPGQPLAAEDLRRAKRKLLTEFELAGSVTIPYRGQALDKATALAAVEQLEDPARQSLMAQLHLSPDLLHVMRTGDFRTLLKLPRADRMGDEDFQRFASGVLAPRFGELLHQFARASDWDAANRLLGRLDLIAGPDRLIALQGMISRVRLLMFHIKQTTASKSELQTWEDIAVCAPGLISVLNRLSHDHQPLRNQYAVALESLAIGLVERVRRPYLAHRVLLAADSLKTDAHIAERIHENQLLVAGMVRAWSASAQGRKPPSKAQQGGTERRPASRSFIDRYGYPGCVPFAGILLISMFLHLFKFGGSPDTPSPQSKVLYEFLQHGLKEIRNSESIQKARGPAVDSTGLHRADSAASHKGNPE